MAYPTVSSALEMKFCLNVVSETTRKVPKDVVYLGERDGAANREKKGKKQRQN